MDLATLNMMRKANGQEALEKLPVEMGGEAGASGSKTKEELEAERVEAERVKAEQEKAAGSGGAPAGSEKKDEELTDEQILAFLKKKGVTANSIDELVKKEETPVDPVKAAEKREADELAYGLTNGLFNRQEYDNYVSDLKDANNLVYAEFYADSREAKPDLTDEEIQAEYLATYGLDKDKDSYQFKRGAKQIKERAKIIVQQKHVKILGAKDAFSKNEQTSKAVADTQKKVAAALPVYKQEVEVVIADLKKLTIPFDEKEKIEVEVAEDDLNAVKAELLSPDYYTRLLSNGYTKDQVKAVVVAGFLAKNFTKLSVAIAKKYLDIKKAGAQGVPLGGPGAKIVEYDPSKFTEQQQKLIEMNKKIQEGKAK